MAGIKSLRKIQLGRESTAGTAVAATTIWRGPAAAPDDQRETVFTAEDVGYVSGIDRSYQPKLLGALAFEETEATFEQLPHILEAGVKTATASQDGAGSDYIYTYTFPTTSSNTLKNYTIEGGDNQQAEEIEYGFVTDFGLSGEGAGAVMMSANWQGRQVSTTTFTGSLSLPTVEEVLFSKGKIYIDAASGTIGTTQKSSTFLSFDLSVTTGWVARFTGDGNLYFTRAAFVGVPTLEVLCNLTFEHDGTATTEISNFRSSTSRLIRLTFEGSTVATPGTTYSKKTLIIDLAGTWDNFESLGEQDGNDVVTGTFRARYNSTASLFSEITVVNELTSLP